MTLWGPHGSICWMRFIAPPPAWKKRKEKKNDNDNDDNDDNDNTA